MSTTAYTILGVAENATQEQIAEAFRLRCAECHPDRATDEADRAARTARMAKLTLAKRYLCDPEARAKYDRKLADLAAQATFPKTREASIDTQDTETLNVFLQRLRTGDAGSAVADFARQAGLADQAGCERIHAASAKGAEVAKGVAELLGLVRGYQR